MTPSLCRFLTLLVCCVPIAFGQEEGAQKFGFQVAKTTAGPGRKIVLKKLRRVKPTAGKPREVPPPQTGLTEEQFQALKESARQGSKLDSTVEPSPAPTNPPSSTKKPTGTPLAAVTFLPPKTNTQNVCILFPADGALAASPAFVLHVNNDCITILNPTGALQAGPTSTATFFGAPAGDIVGDPRALFDPRSNRFIIIAADFTTNKLFLAASQTANPTLGWSIFTFSMGGANACGDFPMLGQTLQEENDQSGAIYVSFNVLTCPLPNGRFTGQNIFVIPKTPVYAGAGFTFFIFSGLTFNGVPVDTVHPANVMNPLDRPRVGFLMNTLNINFSNHCFLGCFGLIVWAIKDGVPPAGGTPSMSGFFTGTPHYFLPANGEQPTCFAANCRLDTRDVRIGGQVVYSSGSLYAASNTNSAVGSPAINAWEVHPTLNDAGVITASQLRNNVCFGCGGFNPRGGAYYGTIQPDSEGTFTMVYNFSSPTVFPGTAFLSRRVTQTTNTFRDSGFFLTLGQGFYLQTGLGTINRWGDYTAVAPSYLTPNSYWYLGMFSQPPIPPAPSGQWAVAIGRNGFGNPDEP